MEEEEETRVEEAEERQEIWSWGAGTDGQLATGSLQDELSPRFIRSLSAPIVSLSCGGAHVIALTPGNLISLSLSLYVYVFWYNVWLGSQVEECWRGEGELLVNWAMGRVLALRNQT